MAVFQTAQGGKILKKLTKELKNVNISSIYCFICIHIFQSNLFKNIQVIGGAKFEDVFANNVVSACFDYRIMFPNIFCTSKARKSKYLPYILKYLPYLFPNF